MGRDWLRRRTGRLIVGRLRTRDETVESGLEQVVDPRIHSAVWHYEIRLPLCRLHESLVHRADRVQILIHRLLRITPSFFHIAQKPSTDANVRRGVHVDEEIEHVTKFKNSPDQNTVQQNDRSRLRKHGFVLAKMRRKIITRRINASTTHQQLQIRDQPTKINRIRVVVVHLLSLLWCEIRPVFIVPVAFHAQALILAEDVSDRLGELGLS